MPRQIRRWDYDTPIEETMEDKMRVRGAVIVRLDLADGLAVPNPAHAFVRAAAAMGLGAWHRSFWRANSNARHRHFP